MSGVAVVDSCVALKWFIDQEDSELALAVLDAWEADGTQPIAPPTFRYELGNVLMEYTSPINLREVEGPIDLTLATSAIEAALETVQIYGDARLIHDATALCIRWERRSLYGMLFVALAQREKATMWTADE